MEQFKVTVSKVRKTEEGTYINSEDVYEQTVEKIDLLAVIKAVNGFEKEEK